MKKNYLIIVFVFAVWMMLFFIFNKSNNKSILPNVNDIDSIDVINESGKISFYKKAEIKELLFSLTNTYLSSKDSVSDEPNVDQYIKIVVICKEETLILYVYESLSKTYIEIPYQGIYQIKNNLYQQLQLKLNK